MKRKLIIFSVLILMFGVVGNASAILFTDTQTLNIVLGDDSDVEVASWNHLMPTDFEVPYDIVNSATLTINATNVTAGDDPVLVEGQFVGTLNPEYLVTEGHVWEWYWVSTTNTSFSVEGAFDSWDTGDQLTVSAVAVEFGGLFNTLTLNSSILELDYDNVAAPAPVPEPATMLLLGTGLVGLAVGSRKKIFKK